MDAILSLYDGKMADENMAELCFALSQDIARETGLTARPAGSRTSYLPRLVQRMEAIPLLGSGKTDYTAIGRMVREGV